MNQHPMSPKILVAPLDWGLGHATRCIPIIKALLKGNCEILIAASGKTKILLQAEFPSLRTVDLPGYEVRYASAKWMMAAKMMVQIPKILSAIKREKLWLEKLVHKERVDAIISDNRYGMHHSKAYSIFITHQLTIKTPQKLVENIVQKINYRYINQFNECWVPDIESENNFSGALSMPKIKPAIPLRYIGILSRFRHSKGSTQAYCLILLSGPEPQRSLLEKIFLDELKEYTGPVIFVRGLPNVKTSFSEKDNVKVFNHVAAAELEKMMSEASIVIARCGYSTVMDLAALKKRSILIPTPGQTEQEYLAKHLMNKKFALCVQQKKFRLKQALELANSFPYNLELNQEQNLQPLVDDLLLKIASNRMVHP